MEAELAKKLVDGLRQAGISFVAYLPESRLSQILPLLREDPSFQLVPVASEAEAVTIAAGAALGGKQAACYFESTGLYVASYSLLVIGKQLGVPLLLVIGFLGDFRDQRNHFLYATIGSRTLPLLDGLGIEYRVVGDGRDLEATLRDAVRTAGALRAPVALLFSGEFTR